MDTAAGHRDLRGAGRPDHGHTRALARGTFIRRDQSAYSRTWAERP
jgi:hypothetical protein